VVFIILPPWTEWDDGFGGDGELELIASAAQNDEPADLLGRRRAASSGRNQGKNDLSITAGNAGVLDHIVLEGIRKEIVRFSDAGA
jgi:hypothetical protein